MIRIKLLALFIALFLIATLAACRKSDNLSNDIDVLSSPVNDVIAPNSSSVLQASDTLQMGSVHKEASEET